MDTRYSANPEDLIHYSQKDLRKEFLIKKLFEEDEIKITYSHCDRAVVLGAMPIKKNLDLGKMINIHKSFGTEYFLERREMGIFNVGNEGSVSVDGKKYKMGFKDCLYITRGAREIIFSSDLENKPSKFYAVSFPAGETHETKLIKITDAKKRVCGEDSKANKRTINQFIHPEVLPTANLTMGLTTLADGSVWNTMPCHTHERRMEVYFYFEIPKDEVVFHFMGEKENTKHIVVKNEMAVISPSYSIHSGVGTASYSFIWAMGGENQTFDDMDNIKNTDLK